MPRPGVPEVDTGAADVPPPPPPPTRVPTICWKPDIKLSKPRPVPAGLAVPGDRYPNRPSCPG